MKTIPPSTRLAKFARKMRGASHSVFYAIQPWYDWGRINAFRLDAITEAEMTEGQVRYLEVQWFGIHVAVIFGRTPTKSMSRGAA
ncbi:hypothetical protein [Sphingomonas abietis]|uniref:DUF4158 domain-containing protein n=1 Tax=Sphingomonas abietis TaxID=3012344 RepID=A0ABY7NSF3_9SPHN|nr:hypothetical protein [Sphingomonas abietis]WBO24477.1 hypothetical protein PBT88_10420 [Sphingomonas abietis]